MAVALRPDFLAEPAQFLAVAEDIAGCADCQADPKSLCNTHRRILPKPLRSTWPRLYGDQADIPGAPTPEVARATLTRKARAAKRVLQMKRRSGMWGLANAILGQPACDKPQRPALEPKDTRRELDFDQR